MQITLNALHGCPGFSSSGLFGQVSGDVLLWDQKFGIQYLSWFYFHVYRYPYLALTEYVAVSVRTSLEKLFERCLTFSASWSWWIWERRRREGRQHAADGTSCPEEGQAHQGSLREFRLLPILSPFRFFWKMNDGLHHSTWWDPTATHTIILSFLPPTILPLTPQNTSHLVVGMTLNPKCWARTHLIVYVLFEESA